MRIKLDCLPCIYRQVLEAARMATDDKKLIREIMDDYAKLVPSIDDNKTSPIISAKMQKIIKEKCNVEDPYKELKERNLQSAKRLLPQVKEEIKTADDSLFASLVMAAMGNSIDAGVSISVDIEKNIENAIENGFTESDYDQFKNELKQSNELLIIADNVGEALFDKLLLMELSNYDISIKYAVRQEAVLNDITKGEAISLGIDDFAEVISSGSKAPGMVMEQASQEFMKVYNNADIIISKGQGNLEGLSDVDRNIYYLLKAKCDLVANLLEVEVGDFVFILK